MKTFELIMVLRMFVSILCAALIGYERENKKKSAGIKTHVLVGLGACVCMLISKYGFLDTEKFDSERLAAQVVSGIGFLGAGMIFVRGNITVEGLTTAAGIWATACIALALGAGMYGIGIIATLCILLLQKIVYASHLIAKRTYILNIDLDMENEKDMEHIRKKLIDSGYEIDILRVQYNVVEDIVRVDIRTDVEDNHALYNITKELKGERSVRRFSVDSYKDL